MDVAINWLVVLGPLLIGAGLAVWGFADGNRSLALWIGFVGCVLLLLGGALQLQQMIWKPRPDEVTDITKRQMRAYIFSTASELRNFGTANRIAAVIELKNSGTTPAYRVRRSIQIFAAAHPMLSFPAVEVGTAEDTIGPGNLVDLGPVYMARELTAGETSNVISGNMVIYVMAKVSYFDAFGDEHHMNFRSYFRGNGTPIQPGAILSLVRDETGGNEAD